MMVKICGITTRQDALACVEAGASALGFNFYPGSPRYVTPETAAAIGEGLPVWKAGVFVNEDPARVEAIADRAGLDIIQLHGEEPPAAFRRRVWKAFRVTEGWRPEQIEDYGAAEAFLLDGPAPGTGVAFDWSRVRGLGARVILAGGLDQDNVARAVELVRPWGVDACSRLETSPGRKDHEKVRRFIRAALAVQL